MIFAQVDFVQVNSYQEKQKRLQDVHRGFQMVALTAFQNNDVILFGSDIYVRQSEPSAELRQKIKEATHPNPNESSLLKTLCDRMEALINIYAPSFIAKVLLNAIEETANTKAINFFENPDLSETTKPIFTEVFNILHDKNLEESLNSLSCSNGNFTEHLIGLIWKDVQKINSRIKTDNNSCIAL